MFSFLCFILSGIVLANSNSYKASGSKTLKSSKNIELVVEVADSSDEIILTLTGPSTVYYAIGFGSYTMEDTYAIIVNGDDDDNVWEQKMGSNAAGDSLQSTFVVKSNTVSDDVRTVILYRSLSTSVGSDYYSFSSSIKSIEVCWACGTSTAFAYHGEENYGATKLTLSVSEETFASDLLQAGWIQRTYIHIICHLLLFALVCFAFI